MRIARNKVRSMFCEDFTVPQILLINLVHLQKKLIIKVKESTSGERIVIVRTTRESSTTSTVDSVSPITTPFASPLKSQLTSPAFSNGQWQSMAVK